MPSPSMTTGLAPGWSSASRKSRPRIGRSPNSLNPFAVKYAPLYRSGGRPSSLTFIVLADQAPRPTKLFCASRQSWKSGDDTMKLRPVMVSRSPTYMTRSGSSKGRLRNRNELTSVNTVAFMPMPSASAVVAAAVNQRSFASRRTPNRMSCSTFMAHSDYGLTWHRRGLPLKPPDGEHCGDRRAELESKNQQRLSGLSWEPLDGEKPDHWNLSCHEELPDVGSGSLVLLTGSGEHRCVTNYGGERGERHRERHERTRALE